MFELLLLMHGFFYDRCKCITNLLPFMCIDKVDLMKGKMKFIKRLKD